MEKNSCTELSLKNIDIIVVFLHSHGAIDAGEGEVQGLDESEAEFLDS